MPEKKKTIEKRNSSGNEDLSLTAFILPVIYVKNVIRLGVVGGRISLLDVDVDPAGAGVGGALSGFALGGEGARSQ